VTRTAGTNLVLPALERRGKKHPKIGELQKFLYRSSSEKVPLGATSREYNNYGVFAQRVNSMTLWVVGGSRRL